VKIFYYITKEKVIPEDLFKNYKKFRESKELFEEEVKKAGGLLNQIKTRDEMINDAFTHALINFKEGENSNFNYIFSSEISHKIKRMKNTDKLEKHIKEKPLDNYDEYIDKKIIIDFIISVIRKMKDEKKCYFCLKYSIKLEKPRDKNEEIINILADNKYTYEEISSISLILFNKKMTRQGIEANIKRTINKIKKEISKDEKIKESLEKILY
jgi:hypothetical protein